MFQLTGSHYDLAVTDPIWRSRLSDLSIGMHPLELAELKSNEEVLFALSLGEPFEGWCYKLIAGVIVIPF